MSREKRLPGGLTHRERTFAELMCKGMRPRDAYRQAGFAKRATDKQASDNASTKAKQPAIIKYMAEWLNRARISDIDSPGAAVAKTLDAINEASDDRNWTAIAALQRLRYQHNGIAERTSVQIEATFSDADILARLANNDPARLAQLRSLLAPASFDDEPLTIDSTAVET